MELDTLPMRWLSITESHCWKIALITNRAFNERLNLGKAELALAIIGDDDDSTSQQSTLACWQLNGNRECMKELALSRLRRDGNQRRKPQQENSTIMAMPTSTIYSLHGES
ncbi:hypothetical protein MRB53_037850 [Persea americana]|nr:hypothetical protein MRB53_037850 [Persea americana]